MSVQFKPSGKISVKTIFENKVAIGEYWFSKNGRKDYSGQWVSSGRLTLFGVGSVDLGMYTYDADVRKNLGWEIEQLRTRASGS